MLLLLLLLQAVQQILCHFPPQSANLTTLPSPVNGNITISYKIPTPGACQTVFPNQQQYTGWVSIPGEYPTNTFFWFIASRDPTDQLTIWLNGGPGTSSLYGLFLENGPCEVVQKSNGVFGTAARDFGWDRASNMLYIDQPNQAGFSYDFPTNGSLDLLTSNLYTPPQILPNTQPADTFLNGTFSSLKMNNTANTTETSAVAIWHFLQAFLVAFPQYNPSLSSSPIVGVSLFTESYGGKYGPAFSTLWEKMNQEERLNANGSTSQNATVEIKLVALGIINGCIDDLVQAPYYPSFANKNTYGLEAINPTRATLANASFYASNGGCQQQIQQCRAAATLSDPNDVGNVSTVNSLCAAAYAFCTNNVIDPYLDAGRSIYDIGHLVPDPFPPSTYLDYLNSQAFQEAIGSPVNYTETNFQVVNAFTSTGDYERGNYVQELSALLNQDVRVALIYGDRDYICNWFGGEAVSLAVAQNTTSGNYSTRFAQAGYAPIITNSTYIGGAVRQYGNLSFSRIYDAGHSVPAYQAETAFQVFARIISGSSLSTGENIDLTTYNTTGPLNSTHTNSLPASPSATCWLRNIDNTCTEQQKSAIIAGSGVIMDGVWFSAASAFSSQTSSTGSSSIVAISTTIITIQGGTTVTLQTTITEIPTGVFVATATPSPTSKGGSGMKGVNNVILFMAALLCTILTA